jgi:hypothetical protein
MNCTFNIVAAKITTVHCLKSLCLFFAADQPTEPENHYPACLPVLIVITTFHIFTPEKRRARSQA